MQFSLLNYSTSTPSVYEYNRFENGHLIFNLVSEKNLSRSEITMSKDQFLSEMEDQKSSFDVSSKDGKSWQQIKSFVQSL